MVLSQLLELLLWLPRLSHSCCCFTRFFFNLLSNMKPSDVLLCQEPSYVSLDLFRNVDFCQKSVHTLYTDVSVKDPWETFQPLRGLSRYFRHFHQEKTLRSWKDPQGSSQGVFPWNIIDGVYCTLFTRIKNRIWSLIDIQTRTIKKSHVNQKCLVLPWK